MVDYSTSYMGLTLRNPIIIGSSGLTDSERKIVDLEHHGAGAVVLKSLFEEQILEEIKEKKTSDPEFASSGAADYIRRYSREQAVNEYLELIRSSCSAVSIPVIASINCTSFSEWVNFAKDIESAGANGLEINLFSLPSDPYRNHTHYEQEYLGIIQEIIKQVSIPVAIKIAPYFSALTNTALKFSWTGIKGLVLFNRSFTPDIDIERLQVIPGNVFSSTAEMYLPLRWTALLSDRVSCDLAASTGIHTGTSMIKFLLAGAKAVQICSTIYQNGNRQIALMLEDLSRYMQDHGYSSSADFIGLMSLKSIADPADYERIQFMKYFSKID